MASQNKIGWAYICDDGSTEYAYQASKAITDQVNGSSAVKVGGEAVGSQARAPQGFKPRTRTFANAAGTVRRQVICYDTACDAWTLAAPTLTLEVAGSDVTMTGTKGKRGERQRDVTRQTG
jgi:hypothetical protein